MRFGLLRGETLIFDIIKIILVIATLLVLALFLFGFMRAFNV